jgi:signal transduction histidine kinase
MDQQAGYFFKKGYDYNKEGKYDSARIVFEEAFKIKGCKEWSGGRLLVNYANSYFYQKNYVEALKYYLEALRVSSQDYHEGQARAMANAGECYYMIGNQQQALYYTDYADSLLYHHMSPHVYLRAQTLYVKACIYMDESEYEKAEEKIREMFVVCDYGLRADSTSGMLWYQAYGLEGMSKINLNLGNFQKAEDFALQSIEVAAEYGDPLVTAKCFTMLSSVHLQQKQYERCKNAAQKAIKSSPEAIKFDPILAYNIATACMFLGEKEKADEYFRIYSDQMKKNIDRNFRETMASMDMQYETEKKLLRISTLEKERLLFIGLIILSCISVISVLLFWQLRMKHHRQEKSLVEMRATARGIMEGETKERKRLAAELHDGVQSLLSAIKLNLDDSDKAHLLINKAIEEVRAISRNLMSKTLKDYGLRVAIEDYCLMFPNVTFLFFGSDGRQPEHIESLLYRCTQELVTNSIKYAQAKNISVQLIMKSAYISLTVFDDGKGFDTTVTTEGTGLSSIHHRINAVNGNIDIVSSSGSGTETTIEIQI